MTYDYVVWIKVNDDIHDYSVDIVYNLYLSTIHFTLFPAWPAQFYWYAFKVYDLILLDLWCLASLSAIFQLYHGDQF